MTGDSGAVAGRSDSRSDSRSGSIEQRLAAVRELRIPVMREDIGWHEFDGVVQDLSASGVSAGLRALNRPDGLRAPNRPDGLRAPNRPDGVTRKRLLQGGRALLHSAGLAGPGGGPAVVPVVDVPADDAARDDVHLQITELGLLWYFGDYQAHRRDPRVHLANLDLSCYDREYAPRADRQAALQRHLALWPAAIDAAVTTLDAVPAPVAAALVGSARGLAQPLTSGPPLAAPSVTDAALRAHARLVTHLERLARDGTPDTAIGARHLAQTMGAFEGLAIDLAELANLADAEHDRIRTALAENCAALQPHRPTREVVAELLRDHPGADGVLPDARAVTAESIAFTRDHALVPWVDGECAVGPAPASRSWATAMVVWAGPYQDDAASWYYITPPDPRWSAEQIDGWLTVFGTTMLPAITVHEVAPGHFAHGRSLRRQVSPVRRQLHSPGFIEGWAHYAEEMMTEAGFRSGDPRFAIGVCLFGLIQITRLVCAIGMHTGALNVDDAAELFERDAFLAAAPARAEAARATFDAGYGRYALGKLEILRVRAAASAAWGSGFSLQRFHSELLGLGAPPLALMPSILG